MTVADSHQLMKAYEAGLAGYTYLECESHLD
jgi:arginine decarboxylase-like protein